jgi:hypothetical protein
MARQASKISEEKHAHRFSNPVRQRLVPLKQAAVYLGRGEDSLRELIYAGAFPVIQEGERSKMWLDIEDLDRWIEAKKQYLRTG